jgi:methylglyoxal/glyoxal reductase
MRGGEILNNGVLLKLGEKYNKTAAQIILRWALQNRVVTIPKSVKRSRLRENADIFDFNLSEDEIQLINNMNRNERLFDYDPNNMTVDTEFTKRTKAAHVALY